METNLADFPLILLAGGKSSRMGQPKGLLRRTEKYWLEEQLAGFSSVGGTHAIVVLGYFSEEYFEKLPWLLGSPIQKDLHIKTAVNETPERGPFSSLQTGGARAAAREPISRRLRSTRRCPLPPEKSLAKGWPKKAEVSALAFRCGGIGRPPGTLGIGFLEELLHCSPDDRLDVRLKQLPPSQVARIPVEDETITRNINTVADWESFRLGYADV